MLAGIEAWSWPAPVARDRLLFGALALSISESCQRSSSSTCPAWPLLLLAARARRVGLRGSRAGCRAACWSTFSLIWIYRTWCGARWSAGTGTTVWRMKTARCGEVCARAYSAKRRCAPTSSVTSPLTKEKWGKTTITHAHPLICRLVILLECCINSRYTGATSDFRKISFQATRICS